MSMDRISFSYPTPGSVDDQIKTHYLGGGFTVESAAVFAWNGWKAWSGIRGNHGLEYAPFLVNFASKNVDVFHVKQKSPLMRAKI